MARSTTSLGTAALLLFFCVQVGCSSEPVASDDPASPRRDASASDPPSTEPATTDPDGGTSAEAGALVWPNAEHVASSDPWLAEHHDEITEMHPKVITINFDNAGPTKDNWQKHVGELIAGFAEGSRYHGYSDAKAKPFLQYEVSQWVDLSDATPPAGWTHKYSTKYPVNCQPDAFYKLDYAALFSAEMAPAFGGKPLCDLFKEGKVHEVWLYANGDPEKYTCPNGKVLDDVGAAEILEAKPIYDANNTKKTGEWNRCAGNGCLGDHDLAAFKACGQTVRVLYINSTRGPGCAMHSAGHGYESMARSNAVPELKPRFEPFGNFDFDTRLKLPFSDWYACSDPSCITWDGPNSLHWKVGAKTGSVPAFDQSCGNVHFAPNARAHYDENDTAVLSACAHYGLHDGPGGKDASELFSRATYAQYETLAPDCGGAWQVYWRQSFPGFGNHATDKSGKPMRNWWPYLFY